MYQQFRTEGSAAVASQTDICAQTIDELRELFLGHFDNYWFTSLLEKNAFNPYRLRYVHDMIGIQSVYNTEKEVFQDGIEALEEIITTSKRYLLPVIRDELKISGFYRSNGGPGSSNDRLMRELFSCTFSHNLERLEELTRELKEIINE